MDAFYEESAINQKSSREQKIYVVLNIFFYVCLIISIFSLVGLLMNITIGDTSGLTEEQLASYQFSQSMMFLSGTSLFIFLPMTIGLFFLKRRVNISYDYVFVSGELRISKVFNINHRKLVVRLDCEDMLQIGDIENNSYERLKSDPSTKEIICTSNVEAASGKFFMYILANVGGKKLYILECREQLLVNILKFAKRGTLESDYVMQEKKQK